MSRSPQCEERDCSKCPDDFTECDCECHDDEEIEDDYDEFDDEYSGFNDEETDDY